MNEGMEQFLGVFLQEAAEQMELLEQDVLKLETGASKELLQEIFRAAHTLKGSSRAMGLNPMGELTHAVEDLFDALRNDQLSVTPSLVDLLFNALDALKAMLEEVAESGKTSLDTVELTSRLRAALSSKEIVAAPVSSVSTTKTEKIELPAFDVSPVQENAIKDALNAGNSIWLLKLSVAPDCVMKSVRALMTLQAIERAGAILAVSPDEDKLENEEFDLTFTVLAATDRDAESLKNAVGTVSEINLESIHAWQNEPETQTNESTPEPAAAVVTSSAPELAVVHQDAAPAAEKKTVAQPQTIRVDVSRLDTLLNLIGELVIDRTRIVQLCNQLSGQYGSDPTFEQLGEEASHVARIADQLQDEVMKARMLPIDNVFSRFPRMIRDLAQKMGKEINFIVEGRETELDRSVIEVVGDPLIHMLRNSVDHGVEGPEEREKAGKSKIGNVWLRARHQENHIVIEVEDDGKGLDPVKLRENAVNKGVLTQEVASRMSDREAMNLIFASGFSTAKEVTDVSGRGVGMDIVRSNLQKLGASIDIDSQVGRGSLFTVKLPLTLAIIRGLLVSVQNAVFALPLSSVVETLRVLPSEVHSVRHQPTIVLRGNSLPLIRMHDLFPMNEDRAVVEAVVHSRNSEEQPIYVVVVSSGGYQIGLIVDTLVGEQEVVIKTLGKFVGDVHGLSGATIMGDGRMALIADIEGIFRMISKKRGVAHAA